ncbi:unnamed protein product [Taenia asiatica]|uniref:C2-C2_1 domain-containing protein n=1 Tax=Taenia asiatica TaxID=60517 RepID=A0A0R3VTB1_TAEAS|nr:unnamed protein product [Taenia asiatica]
MFASQGDREKQYEEMRRIHNTLQTRARTISYPTDHAHIEAAERLDRAHLLPTTRHRVAEKHQRTMKNATDQFDLIQICADTRLPESESIRIIGPGPHLALPITRSLPGERSSFEEGENLFEINLGETNLTLDQLEACPNGVLCIWRFYNFKVQSTCIVRGKRSNFNFTVQYPVIMDELFCTYLHERHYSMELYKVLPGLPSQEIGEFELGLQYLIQPDSYASTNASGTARHSVRVSRVDRCRAPKQHRQVEGEKRQQQHFVGQVLYWMGFRAPIEHSLHVYKPPATDIRLITLKESPRLDSPGVLLIEEKEGSFLGMVDILLLGLAESDGSANGTSQVHQQPSKTPKIPPRASGRKPPNLPRRSIEERATEAATALMRNNPERHRDAPKPIHKN